MRCWEGAASPWGLRLHKSHGPGGGGPPVRSASERGSPWTCRLSDAAGPRAVTTSQVMTRGAESLCHSGQQLAKCPPVSAEAQGRAASAPHPLPPLDHRGRGQREPPVPQGALSEWLLGMEGRVRLLRDRKTRKVAAHPGRGGGPMRRPWVWALNSHHRMPSHDNRKRLVARQKLAQHLGLWLLRLGVWPS